MANREHAFGVTKHSGGRVILQIDFPARQIRVLDRGVVKRCSSFFDINQKSTFFSQNGLTFSLVLQNKEITFIADSPKEKNTICTLIQLAVQPSVAEEAVTCKTQCRRIPSLDENQHVIKEGYLEKKGNAAIVLWERRRVRIMAGYFAYYKPKKKNALHIVNMSEETAIDREEDFCFRIKVKDRVYWFRLIDEQRTTSEKMKENEMQEWLSALRWSGRGNRITIREYETEDTTIDDCTHDDICSTLSISESPLALSARKIPIEELSSVSEIDEYLSPRQVFSKSFETEIMDALSHSMYPETEQDIETLGFGCQRRPEAAETTRRGSPINNDAIGGSVPQSKKHRFSDEIFNDEDAGDEPLPFEKKSLNASDEDDNPIARTRSGMGPNDYPADYLQGLENESIKMADIGLEQRDKSDSTIRDPSVHISAIESTEILENDKLKSRPKPASFNKGRMPMKIQERPTICDSDSES